MWIPFFLKQHEFEQEAPLLTVGDTGPSDTTVSLCMRHLSCLIIVYDDLGNNFPRLN